MTRGAIPQKRVVIAICVVLLAATCLLLVTYQSDAAQSDYRKGYETGLLAYTYGLPLLQTNVTFATMTSTSVSNGAFGPVNQFNNERSLNTAGNTAVVAPGSNALSSIAWLDLRNEPQVLHVPEVPDHFYILAFIDPYTNNIVNLGNVNRTAPGYYVICGPGQETVSIPAGTERIDVDYSRIWIIGSTQLKGANDTATVNKIQDGYTLTPLSRFGTNASQTRQAGPGSAIQYYKIPAGLAFYDALGQQLALFPPPAADQPVLARFAEVGIGPDMSPSQDPAISKDTLRGLADAIAAGPQQIKNDTRDLYGENFSQHNGYLLGGFGQYGTNYRLRAVISQIGLGAFTPDQAIYAIAWADQNKTPLSGSNRYVLHLAAAPPVNEGWTLTVYNLNGGLVNNSISRYEFSDASNLTRNADGSADIYLQAAQPTDPAQADNWLPVTPAGQGFEVMWRLMAPNSTAIPGILDGSGWQPPAVKMAG